jgi:hypothetical protein
MITEVHNVAEGENSKLGINLWDGDEKFTSFRLIYNSPSTSFYFRIRGVLCPPEQPRYIFEFRDPESIFC